MCPASYGHTQNLKILKSFVLVAEVWWFKLLFISSHYNRLHINFEKSRGPHCTGKTGKMAKKYPC